MKSLNKVLKDALARKPRRLSFETTYDHQNMLDWLIGLLLFRTVHVLHYPIGQQRESFEMG
jgi:hypothetical protein